MGCELPPVLFFGAAVFARQTLFGKKIARFVRTVFAGR
jgi:hypothetical protein